MTKRQTELMFILKNADKWLTAEELAQRSNLSATQVRRIVSSDIFSDVKKGKLDTGRPHGGRYVTVYKLFPKQKTRVDDAMELARQHQGVWGQLMWANKLKVEMQ